MKTRVLMVFPSHCDKPVKSLWPPLGIAYIASYCLEMHPDLAIKAIDFTVEEFSPEKWRQELADFKPEVVGISTQAINHESAMLICRLTKQFDSSILTVVGGVHATVFPEQCLDYCDVVVRGEGEETFNDLIEEHEWNTIKGICYRQDDKITHNLPREWIKDLDSLPLPAIRLFPIEKYHVKSYLFVRQGLIIGSRGCPYNCTFCLSPYT